MFNLQDNLQDFGEFRQIIGNYLRSLVADSALWTTRTGARDKDWTLHEVLAHLVSIAECFNHATRHALNNEELHIEQLTHREDLRRLNESEIERLTQNSPSELTDSLLAELDESARMLQNATPAQLQQKAFLRVYNRPARGIDFIDWQLSHAGIIHASQIKRVADNVPLWEQYSPEFARRQVDRYIRHFSIAYWQDYAPDVDSVINFHIAGESGGVWHIFARPDGGDTGSGEHPNAQYNLYFDRPASLFSVFSVHLPPTEAVANGAMRVDGDVMETMALLRLFAASPPGA